MRAGDYLTYSDNISVSSIFFGGEKSSMLWDLDRCITEFDKGLKVVLGEPAGQRQSPADALDENELDDKQRRDAAALMRVNHCGEVCAQALYQGQALASSSERIRATLANAAREEADHLAWSAQRVRELGGRLSLLNPLWYAGSLALGYAAGRLGDRWNLGFLAETERQVEQHLQRHIERLGRRDQKTICVIETMQREEAGHRRSAEALGARALPQSAKIGMQAAARVMTTLSHWI